ncbi:MAG TPA: hypothetical protein VD735_01455 [Candidatus Saccharimonadales bacterium]|nr:hypothetical protein [Candidatus Saccharimonadales bacterium]
MARLPTPGSDDGQWGTLLNDFLATAHTSDGSLKPGVVGDSQVSSVSQAKITGLPAALSAKTDTTVTYGTTARVFYNTIASSYPARPSGFTSVEWVGPVAPTIGGAGNAVDGFDTWINTA